MEMVNKSVKKKEEMGGRVDYFLLMILDEGFNLFLGGQGGLDTLQNLPGTIHKSNICRATEDTDFL